jgi:hypothetical protein
VGPRLAMTKKDAPAGQGVPGHLTGDRLLLNESWVYSSRSTKMPLRYASGDGSNESFMRCGTRFSFYAPQPMFFITSSLLKNPSP